MSWYCMDSATRLLPASPMRWASSMSVSSRTAASAISAVDSGSTRSPVLPSWTASTTPPVRPPIAALPHAAASRKTIPKPSVSPFSSFDGITKRSQRW